MCTCSPGLNPLPLYAPVRFRYASPLNLPTHVLYGWPLTAIINPIHKTYLHICKSFLAHAIVSLIKVILHTILKSTKCLIKIMIIT